MTPDVSTRATLGALALALAIAMPCVHAQSQSSHNNQHHKLARTYATAGVKLFAGVRCGVRYGMQ